MRRFCCLFVIIVALLSSLATAGPTADSIAFQGQLTDASSTPVPDGPRDLTLSVWSDSVGGTMLFSQVVAVTVSKGLFSTCLGCGGSDSFFDIFTDQPLFLQTQLAGQAPMTPRTRLRNVPRALVANGLYGEASSGSARGRGIISVKSGTGSGTLSSRLVLDADSDGDGLADYLVTDSVATDGASQVMAKKGINAVNVKLARSISSPPGGAEALDVLDVDSDGDGVPESSDSSVITGGSAGRRLKVHNLGSSGEDGVEVTPFSARRRLSSSGLGSSGQDGVEVTLSSVVHQGGVDTDGDGVPDQVFEQILTPTSSSVAIKTKGTGADPNRVVTTTSSDSVITEHTFEFTNSLLMPALMKAKEKANRTKCSNNLRYQSPVATNEAELAVDSAGSGLTMSADSDGDGVPEAKISGKIIAGQFSGGPGTVSLQLADIDDDGVPESEISQTVLPTTSSMAIKTKGTGAAHNRSAITQTSDISGTLTVHSVDSDDDGVADREIREQCDDDDASITVARGSSEIKIRHKGWDGTIKGRMAIETGGAIEVDFGGDGVGFVSQRFGIGVLSPTHPIEHSSGAHLTAGGVWTNASDANLKENFQSVDGAEMLDKIAQLPISEWNYKNESDETKHIGPTAQDFQKVFGVGENDKTISTIDPSGIALAAIKQLNKENKELKAELEQLKALVARMARENTEQTGGK
jgi:hypothetical protein